MGPRRRRLPACLPALAALAALACSGAPEAPEATLAYVASAGNNHVRVIDLTSGETLRKIYSGATPWRLVVSPDGLRLWVQHWYAGTTAVVNLEDHEIEAVLPVRGPGAFEVESGSFVTFSWPDATLRTFDGTTFETLDERVTEIRQVYDLLPGPGGGPLYLLQHDPMARGPAPRYGYVLSYDVRRAPEAAAPVSLSTGAAPVALARPPGQPFVITADSGTNGLSLINEHGDGRAFAACPAPREVAFTGDGSRMAVLCWRGDGWRQSEVVVFRSDFAARPWPVLEEQARATLPGGLVAAAFSPGGEHLYAADRTGGLLLELASATLAVERELPAGDVPVDLVLRRVSAAVRDRLAAGESSGRRLARQTLEGITAAGAPFTDLSWTEETLAAEDAAAGDEEAARRVRMALQAPDALHLETEEGGVRVARDGFSVTRDAVGRFWVAPRQELLSTVLALPGLSPEAALRRLAGDVPGSPFLRGGLAMDLATEVEREGQRLVVLGASDPTQRVSQLWVDPEAALPAALAEQFPSFQPAGAVGHGAAPPVEIVETHFTDFVRVGDGLRLPTALERVIPGGWVQYARLSAFKADRGLPAEWFDPARLGGMEAALDALFEPLPAAPAQKTPGSGKPGRAVPRLAAGPETSGEALPGPRPPSIRYTSNPPTSGPHLSYAADWGVHTVPVPLPLQVHNLLDGGVALQYNCPRGCPDLAAQLAAVAREHDRVLVAPYPLMDSRLALTAWGRVEYLDAFDRDRVEAFLRAWGGKDHHGEIDEPSGRGLEPRPVSRGRPGGR